MQFVVRSQKADAIYNTPPSMAARPLRQALLTGDSK